MKNKVIIFLLFISFCCQSKRTLSHKVIRQNYFDSNYYKLNSLDTNNVNRLIYESIFDRVQFDTSVNCLLMKIYYDTYAQEEYGLYDYKSGKYFYTSANDGKTYNFKESSTGKSKEVYTLMQKYIKDTGLLSRVIHEKNGLLDGGSFETSLIYVNSQKEVLVKSYHW